ncbi:MAG: hypothetical protein JO078_02975 [Candidatus Eremiobacteraeota bacterium]|nr:hypothetical protein [Candidatus Eremiobacteraeota bacterium]
MRLPRLKGAAIAAVVALSINGCQGAGLHGSSFVPASFRQPLTSSVDVIYSFAGAPDGWGPEANPIVDASGALYGTTSGGGTSSACGTKRAVNESGCGTIYKLKRLVGGRWKETLLWSFDLNHGAYPGYPLVAGASGSLYGTTQVGGNLGVAYGLFHGTHARKFAVLHNFLGNRDGAQPRSALVFDKSGNLYGTTVSGGSGGSGGGGTVYELVPSGNKWTEKISYRFAPYGPSGANPQAPVVFGRSGSLYGTTSYGGNSVCPSGCGVVFALSPAGKGAWKESVLHSFSGGDGCTSVGGLVADAAGNFYGSTNLGGPSFPTCHGGCGTIFELHGSHGHWSFAVIHDFTTNTGCGPSGNMALDAAGNLYGTTVIGGSGGGNGVVFRLARKPHGRWSYTVLHAFNNTPDGSEPTGLILAANGKLYGTTIGGGALGVGSVFEATP